MSISEDLAATGISVQDGYLNVARVRALQECLEARRRSGDFARARIGRALTLQENPEVRGDRTCWLCAPMFAAEDELLQDFERLRMELNRNLTLGLFELELHYAWYPAGARYARHIDNARGSAARPNPGARRVSLVLYLNDGWQSGAGGELELYEDHDACRRIEPFAGRLVCFLTEGREHAVLRAHRDRFSISGWYRTRAQPV
jgi:SM-20-related protein